MWTGVEPYNYAPYMGLSTQSIGQIPHHSPWGRWGLPLIGALRKAIFLGRVGLASSCTVERSFLCDNLCHSINTINNHYQTKCWKKWSGFGLTGSGGLVIQWVMTALLCVCVCVHVLCVTLLSVLIQWVIAALLCVCVCVCAPIFTVGNHTMIIRNQSSGYFTLWN